MKYRKKPVVIEAEQFWPDKKPWPEGVVGMEAGPMHSSLPQGTFLDAWIPTLEGNMTVTPGDFIITGIKGERYACKPDIFAATYEPVEDEG